MKKYLLWALGILFFGSLAFTAFNAAGVHREQVRKRYAPSPLTVVIDWKISKPFDLQIFYLPEKYGQFTEQFSVHKTVTPADKHVEVVLPVKRIYNFRLDFGSAPGKILIKNIEIKGDMHLNFNSWHDYAYANIERYKIHHDDNSLEIYSDLQDPFMVFSYPFVLDEKPASGAVK